GHRMVAEEVALSAMAGGDAVDASPPHLQDARGAVDVLAHGGREKGSVELRGERIPVDAEPCLDREPHRAISRGHERRTVDDAAGALERSLVRQLEHALVAAHLHHAKAIGPQEARAVEQLLQRLLQAASSMASAVASPPPMQRLATPRLRPYLRSAPISVTTMRAPEAPIGCPSAHAPP